MRFLLDIVLVISLLFFPWYITGLLLLAGIILFSAFYEAVVAAIVMDTLYYVPTESFVSSWIMTTSVIIVYIVVRFIQSRVRT